MRRSTLLLACCLIAAPAPGWAASPAGPAATKQTDKQGFPALDPLVDPMVAAMEDDIARIAQTRAATGADVRDLLEFRIDLRILRRWALLSAASAEGGSDLQATLWLRAKDLGELVAAADGAFDAAKSGAALIPRGRTEALLGVRQLTYDLPEKPAAGRVDGLLKQVAALAPAALGETVKLAPMRPPTPAAAGGRVETPAAAGDSLEALGARAGRVAVSPALRRQLLDLASAASLAAKDARIDPEAAKDAQTLRAALSDAVALADGLQRNTAVGADDRMATERRLSDAIVLFADPRTRSAGTNRLAGLRRYGELVSKIAALDLPQTEADRLAPLFVYAKSHPEASAALLGAAETYRAAASRAAGRPAVAAESDAPYGSVAAAAGPAARAVADDFAAARRGFLTDAASIGGGGDVFATRPEQIVASADKLRRLNDLLDAALAAPAAVERLSIYRPLPTGGLERRAKIALVQLADSATGAEGKRAGEAFLVDLKRLADADAALKRADVGEYPKEVDAAYTGGRAAEFGRHWPVVVAQQATAATAAAGGAGGTGGKGIDPAALDRLEAGVGLIQALTAAVDLEKAVGRTGALQRWADWSVGPGEANRLLGPYRGAMTAAFAGFNADRTEPVAAFADVADREAPVLAWLRRSADAYGPACDRMPDGLPGTVGRLGTPSADAPFADERFLSLAAEVSLSGRVDKAAPERLRAEMVRRVAGGG